MASPKRDSAYMRRIENSLDIAWRAHPDWRFGQLVVNALREGGSPVHAADVFYPEDDVLEKGLAKIVARRGKRI